MRIIVPCLLALSSIAMLSSCVPASRPPEPVRVAPPPVVALPVPALAADWRDWPYNPGDWTYAREGSGSVARFGVAGAAPVMTLRCAARAITLTRAGTLATPLTIRTSSTARTLTVAPTDQGVAATLAATDPLLDAMGFSRGRFVVSQAGQPPLVVPAWAEIERVVEDCRG